MAIQIINREQFLATYTKYLPKKWIVFAFKYFSKETEKKNMRLNSVIIFLLGVSFLIGMIGTIAQWPRPIILWATFGYTALLSILVIFLLAAVWVNNVRIKKIAEELGCSLQEYNELADKYFNKIIK